MKVIPNKHIQSRGKIIWIILNNGQYIDLNKVANVGRQILRNKRLIDTEILQTKEAAKNLAPEGNVEPVLIIGNLDNEEIKQMINKIREGEKIIQ